jgi:DNA-binding transcriptional ArsR family regulator
MIEFELGVEDLADTRFAMSPLQETVFSLWTLREPGLLAIHIPWRRAVAGRLDGLDTALLLALVGESRALPDFLTPRPPTFAPTVEEQLARVRATPLDLVRRDLLATHAGYELPPPLHPVTTGEVGALLGAICDALYAYWAVAVKPFWPRMRLVLEAEMTYRARQLATGGARLLFADMHPNLEWRDGVLRIDKMIGHHRVVAGGRGLLLEPAVFAYKPVPPLHADEPPSLAYPCRGAGTLWEQAPEPDATALAALLGAPRAGLLRLLAEPLPTVELARRLRVTPSAVSQHLKVLHANGLVTRVRDGRLVLYRRSPLGDRLLGEPE